MNTTKFTPGPWKATILDSYGRFEIAPAQGGRCIAKPGSGWGDASQAEEREANARLLAAAPELWATLKMTLDAFKECVGHDAWREFEEGNVAVKLAQATLSKVEGQA